MRIFTERIQSDAAMMVGNIRKIRAWRALVTTEKPTQSLGTAARGTLANLEPASGSPQFGRRLAISLRRAFPELLRSRGS